MLANEAIRHGEQELKIIRQRIEYLKGKIIRCKEMGNEPHLNQAERQLAFCSEREEEMFILVESAKVLHELMDYGETVGENLSQEVFIKLWDDYLWNGHLILTKEQAKKIGMIK